jgi:hypothetical protein
MRLALLALLVAPPLFAADASGLDLTIEVLGREDRVDERIVNRIEIPGIQMDRVQTDVLNPVTGAVGGVVQGVGGLVEGVVTPLLPVLRYEEWVEQRRAAGRERERPE